MLPILSRFNGVAVPDPNGEFLLYHFPELYSAMSARQASGEEFPLQQLGMLFTFL